MATIYTSIEKLITRMPMRDIVELTDDDEKGDVDAVVLDQAIADVGAEIDSKLRGRYPLPLVGTVPDIIEHIAAILVIHNLYSRKHQLTLSDGLARQYKKALADLNELQTGLQVLPGYESSDSHPAFIASNKTAKDRAFSQSLLSRY